VFQKPSLLLLSNGADILRPGQTMGETALHIRAPVVAILCPDIEAIASQGWTALHFALVSNQKRRPAEKLVELVGEGGC
jgi:hypothetical protein